MTGHYYKCEIVFFGTNFEYWVYIIKWIKKAEGESVWKTTWSPPMISNIFASGVVTDFFPKVVLPVERQFVLSSSLWLQGHTEDVAGFWHGIVKHIFVKTWWKPFYIPAVLASEYPILLPERAGYPRVLQVLQELGILNKTFRHICEFQKFNFYWDN